MLEPERKKLRKRRRNKSWARRNESAQERDAISIAKNEIKKVIIFVLESRSFSGYKNQRNFLDWVYQLQIEFPSKVLPLNVSMTKRVDWNGVPRMMQPIKIQRIDSRFFQFNFANWITSSVVFGDVGGWIIPSLEIYILRLNMSRCRALSRGFSGKTIMTRSSKDSEWYFYLISSISYPADDTIKSP